jgi:hypothetical protein
MMIDLSNALQESAASNLDPTIGAYARVDAMSNLEKYLLRTEDDPLYRDHDEVIEEQIVHGWCGCDNLHETGVGAVSLTELAVELRSAADDFDTLADEGYMLEEPIESDGFVIFTHENLLSAQAEYDGERETFQDPGPEFSTTEEIASTFLSNVENVIELLRGIANFLTEVVEPDEEAASMFRDQAASEEFFFPGIT